MKLLFLTGTDAPGAFVMLFLLTGFVLGIFFLCKYLLTKIFNHFSQKRLIRLSVLSAMILVPVILITLVWTMVGIFVG
jgi:chromate transport protein ChrA